MIDLLENRIVAYYLALSLADSMLHNDAITFEQYTALEVIFAEKFGLSSRSIYRDIAG